MLDKIYRIPVVRRIKDMARPFKHALVGKEGIYRAIEEVNRLREVTTVFDVGAADGEYAGHFHKNFPKATIYCFEPLRESFDKIPSLPRIDKERVAISNKNGFCEINHYPHADSSSLFSKQGMNGKREKVLSKTLDTICKENKTTSIDFLKIDVEGFELEVLEGATEALRITKTAFIEIQPWFRGKMSRAHIDIFELMHKADFEFTGNWGDFFFEKR